MATGNKINGVQLYWEQSGQSGESLVLVHGSWVDHHNWDAVVPGLSQTFRVFTYDRRGHSQSERTDSAGSIREDVADLAALITSLNLAPCHIVGHSFGGSIVLRLAAERPELFQSLIVHEPPLMSLLVGTPNTEMVLQTVQARIGAVVGLLEAGDIEGGVRQFVETIAFGPGMWDKIPLKTRQIAISNALTFLDEMHDAEAFSIDLVRLRNFPHPALLMLGEQGPPFFPPIMEQLTRALPRAERKMFVGTGHEPEISDPENYVATLIEFTARATSSSNAPFASAT
jgi:pimeloyl-ACP methyl ester carboxylesterase